MECYMGQIELFPFGFAPQNWLLCNGALLQITQNTALYTLLGTNFGGDGHTTFAVPNLMNAIPFANPNPSKPQMAYYIALAGYYPTRE